LVQLRGVELNRVRTGSGLRTTIAAQRRQRPPLSGATRQRVRNSPYLASSPNVSGALPIITSAVPSSALPSAFPSDGRAAAFFDLDKTIIAGSSALAFSRPFRRQGLISRRAALRSGYAQLLLMLSGADADTMELLRRRITALCTGWEVAQIRSIVAETLHEIVQPLVYAEAAELIAEHRANGDEVVVLSASGLEVVEPIAALVGADRCQATRMRVENGRYSGVIEYYCYGPGHRGRARLPARRLPGLLGLDHRPAAAGGRRASDRRQPGSGAAQAGRPARLAGVDLRCAGGAAVAAAAGSHRHGGRGRRRGGRVVQRRVVRPPAAEPILITARHPRWAIVRIGGFSRHSSPLSVPEPVHRERSLAVAPVTDYKEHTDFEWPGAVRQRSTRPPRSGSVREDRALHAQHAAGGMSSWACVPGRWTPRPQHDT
jgi:HAD superfamily hydrolase (TIGR01490 family)